MKTVLKALKVTYTLLFAIFIVIAIFITLTSIDLIKGYNFYVVMSGSMEPSIKTGSIVGVKEQTQYQLEDVITVKMKNDPTQTYTHRIVEVTEDSYVTKGDANETTDPDTASKEQVVGSVFATVPFIGYAVHFAKQPTGFILMVIVPSIIIISLELNNIKESIVGMVKKKEITSSKKETNEEV